MNSVGRRTLGHRLVPLFVANIEGKRQKVVEIGLFPPGEFRMGVETNKEFALVVWTAGSRHVFNCDGGYISTDCRMVVDNPWPAQRAMSWELGGHRDVLATTGYPAESRSLHLVRANNLLGELATEIRIVLSETMRISAEADSMLGISKIESCCSKARGLDELVTVANIDGYRYICFPNGKRLRLISPEAEKDAVDVLGIHASNDELWPERMRKE